MYDVTNEILNFRNSTLNLIKERNPMSYKKVSNPNASNVINVFAKRTPGATNKSQAIPRIIEVESFDTSKRVLIGKEVEKGWKVEFSIAATAFAEHEAREGKRIREGGETPKYVGHNIDERMAKNIGKGEWVIIEDTIITKKVAEGHYLMEGTYLHAATDSNPEKVYRGFVTVQPGTDVNIPRGKFLLDWKPELRVNINDEDGLNKIGDLLDNAIAKREEGAPSMGYCLLAMVPKLDDKQNKYYVPVDIVSPREWHRAQKDEKGAVVVEGRPFNGDDLFEDASSYLAYLKKDNGSGVPQIDVIKKTLGLTQEEVDGLTVEVQAYRKLLLSSKSKQFAIPSNPKHPFHQMIMSSAKEAVTDEKPGWETGVGGCRAIVELTADKVSPDPSDKTRNIIESRNLVSRFSYGYVGHIFSLLPASDGSRCRVHPSLDIIKPSAPENAASAAASSTAQDSSMGLDLGQAQETKNHYDSVFDTKQPEQAAPTAPAAAFAQSHDPFADDDASEAPAPQAEEPKPEAPATTGTTRRRSFVTQK